MEITLKSDRVEKKKKVRKRKLLSEKCELADKSFYAVTAKPFGTGIILIGSSPCPFNRSVRQMSSVSPKSQYSPSEYQFYTRYWVYRTARNGFSFDIFVFE